MTNDTGPRWPTTKPTSPTNHASHKTFIGRAGRFDVWVHPLDEGDAHGVAAIFRAPSDAEWHLDDMFYTVGPDGIEQRHNGTFPCDLDPTPAELCDIYQLLNDHHKDHTHDDEV